MACFSSLLNAWAPAPGNKKTLIESVSWPARLDKHSGLHTNCTLILNGHQNFILFPLFRSTRNDIVTKWDRGAGNRTCSPTVTSPAATSRLRPSLELNPFYIDFFFAFTALSGLLSLTIRHQIAAFGRVDTRLWPTVPPRLCRPVCPFGTNFGAICWACALTSPVKHIHSRGIDSHSISN